jgi:hypothetical protein
MKRFYYIIAFAFLTSVFALTPNERKMVQTIKTQVEEGQADYAASQAALSQANHDTAAAAQTAATTASDLAEAQKKFDTVNKDNARMKPVYDQCTKFCGFGAILYGVGRIIHCLMWLVIGVVALIVVIVGLSIAFPAFGAAMSIVATGLRIPLAALHNVLLRFEAWLKSRKPAPTPTPPPAPVTAPAAPPPDAAGPTGAVGPS